MLWSGSYRRDLHFTLRNINKPLSWAPLKCISVMCYANNAFLKKASRTFQSGSKKRKKEKKHWMKVSSAVLALEHCLDMICWGNECERGRVFGEKQQHQCGQNHRWPPARDLHYHWPLFVCLAGTLHLGRLVLNSQMEKLISCFKSNCFKLHVYQQTFWPLKGKVNRLPSTWPLWAKTEITEG